MNKLLLVIMLTLTSSVLAKNELLIEVNNDLNQFKLYKIQAVYNSKASLFCGKFDEGSLVPNKEFIDFTPSNSINVLKSFKRGLCEYKLSGISVLALNPYGNPATYVSVPVVNPYNERIFGDLPIANDFIYNCRNTEDYGCDDVEEVASITLNYVSIYMGSRF